MKEFKFSDYEWTKIEKSIKAEKDLIKEFETGKRKLVTRQDEKGDFFLVFKVDKKLSIVANYFLKKYPKIKYCLAVNDFDKDELKLSARSRNDFNCLNIEGFCGHECAAGYKECTNQLCEDLLLGTTYSLKRLD